jgi:hypothetical protein
LVILIPRQRSAADERCIPAAPANAALVRNWRRVRIGMEHLPDPNSWITMFLARWPIRAVRIEASAALGCPQDCRP